MVFVRQLILRMPDIEAKVHASVYQAVLE